MRDFKTILIAAILTAAVFFSGPAMAKPEVGAVAPLFKAELLSGGELDLTPEIGKKAILLDFWSIYCVACVQQMPSLVNLQEKFGNKLFTVGIDLDSFGTKRVKKFVNGLKFKIPYPIVVDKRRKVAAKYSVSVLPTTVIIDKEGKVALYHVGYKKGDEKHFEEVIAKIVGE